MQTYGTMATVDAFENRNITRKNLCTKIVGKKDVEYIFADFLI